MHHLIQTEIQKSLSLLQQIHLTASIHDIIEKIARQCITALQAGNKLLFIGNGGSAADAQHLAAELVGRLRFDRPALAAVALTTDTSALTAIGNDYDFEHIYSRQVEALGQPNDVLIGISTSGKSPNILRAFEMARAKQMMTIGFTGSEAPLFRDRCDLVLTIPAQETSKIQECHIMIGHIICLLIEETLFGNVSHPHSG